jgi:hypothetical protein
MEKKSFDALVERDKQWSEAFGIDGPEFPEDVPLWLRKQADTPMFECGAAKKTA